MCREHEITGLHILNGHLSAVTHRDQRTLEKALRVVAHDRQVAVAHRAGVGGAIAQLGSRPPRRAPAAYEQLQQPVLSVVGVL
ncbi:MAG TPA: hypothetical protein VES97_04255, partial [Solirubrobacteraceae bacterium]|nr:hypothetical protein [Solirubrobacteraceae bacterium]